MFPNYVNALYLKDENGNVLELDEAGNGTFKEYMKQVVMESAKRAMESGIDLSNKSWLIINNEKVQDMDWHEYAKDITRMKTAPAFDALTMDSPENDLFGNKTTNVRHFTEYAKVNSLLNGEMAEENIVKMLNPMNYVEDDKATKTQHWRIRHGECDRDTSLSISAMLTLKLREYNCEVDYHSPWNVPHSGDYDLDALFAWIDKCVTGV